MFHLASYWGMFDNTTEKPQKPEKQLNVLQTDLEVCGTDPMTGFYRDGCCNTGMDDGGTHTVCVIVTDEFLQFSKSKGNDLSTPIPQFGFAGLKAGDSCVYVRCVGQKRKWQVLLRV